MSLKDYSVASDNFQLHPKGRHHAEFAFPCCCCAYATAPDNFQPCASCDHNANSVRQVDRINKLFGKTEEHLIELDKRLEALEKCEKLMPLLEAFINNLHCLQVHPLHVGDVKQTAAMVMEELAKLKG